MQGELPQTLKGESEATLCGPRPGGAPASGGGQTPLHQDEMSLDQKPNCTGIKPAFRGSKWPWEPPGKGFRCSEVRTRVRGQEEGGERTLSRGGGRAWARGGGLGPPRPRERKGASKPPQTRAVGTRQRLGRSDGLCPPLEGPLLAAVRGAFGNTGCQGRYVRDTTLTIPPPRKQNVVQGNGVQSRLGGRTSRQRPYSKPPQGPGSTRRKSGHAVRLRVLD